MRRYSRPSLTMENLRERSPSFPSARPQLVDLNRCQIKIAPRLTYFFSLASPIYVPALQARTFKDPLLYSVSSALAFSRGIFKAKRARIPRARATTTARTIVSVFTATGPKAREIRKKKAERAPVEGYSTKRKRRRPFDKD